MAEIKTVRSKENFEIKKIARFYTDRKVTNDYVKLSSFTFSQLEMIITRPQSLI